MDNYYKVLGVTIDASPEELKVRLVKKIKALIWLGVNQKKIKKIEDLRLAFDNLIDPALRNQHDLSLKLYNQDEAAPWRVTYQNYSNQSLKQDLNFSSELIAELVENLENKPRVSVVAYLLIFLLLLVSLVLFYILQGSNSQFIWGDKDLVVPRMPHLQGQIFTKDEQTLFNELSDLKKKELKIILNQIDQVRLAPNFPELLNSCKIHLEAVSISEELYLKYEGLLSCLRTASKV